MKIDRLIGIITILLQKDKVTAPELAKRFEVSILEPLQLSEERKLQAENILKNPIPQ